jgi:hypothetical protein
MSGSKIRQKLKDDFEHYASALPADPNQGGQGRAADAQPRPAAHSRRLEEQRRATGKVRALVLKGRQMGASTYIGGRFYWRTTHSRGHKTFILTHEQAATDNLFKMVERYHEQLPGLVRPQPAHPTPRS